MLSGEIGEDKIMSENNLTSLRITDISLLDGKDWEVVTSTGIIGVSYRAKNDSARLGFTDEKGNNNNWTFQNDATITFRGSNLLYNQNTRNN